MQSLRSERSCVVIGKSWSKNPPATMPLAISTRSRRTRESIAVSPDSIPLLLDPRSHGSRIGDAGEADSHGHLMPDIVLGPQIGVSQEDEARHVAIAENRPTGRTVVVSTGIRIAPRIRNSSPATRCETCCVFRRVAADCR